MNEVDEIKEIGDVYIKLYVKCWETVIDIYSRHFCNKEQADRDALIQMTNNIFDTVAQRLLPTKKDDILDE